MGNAIKIRKPKSRTVATFFIILMLFASFEGIALNGLTDKAAASSKTLPKALEKQKASFEAAPTLADKKLDASKAKGSPTPTSRAIDGTIGKNEPTNTAPIEILEKREAAKDAFRNADGSITEKNYFGSKYYQNSGSWKPIDSSLKEDTNAANSQSWLGKIWGQAMSLFTSPTTFTTQDNSWQTRFAPSNGKVAMVRVQYGTQLVGFSPVAAKTVTPVISRNSDDTQTVHYYDLWPGVDVEYLVRADTVKENIIIKDKNATNIFKFAVSGATLEADATNPGGFKLKDALNNEFGISPINLIINKYGLETKSVYRQELKNNELQISVDQDYIKALPADAFPAVIDPSVYRSTFGTRLGGGNYVSFKSDGYVCYSNVCNLYAGTLYDSSWILRAWRGAFYSPFDVLRDHELRYANLHLTQETNMPYYTGNYNNNWFNAYHATCLSSINCIDPNDGGGATYLSTVGDINVTSIYQNAKNRGDWGAWLMVAGDEGQANTWKSFNPDSSFVDFTYNTHPAMPTPAMPGTDVNTNYVVTSTHPQIGVNAVGDPDGDLVSYKYQLSSTTGAVLYQSDWLSQDRFTVPEGLLQDGGSYVWYMAVADTYWGSAFQKGGSFSVDLRKGKNKTSSYDEVGPLSVNIANGNGYTHAATHSINAMGGPIGLDLNYNSPLASQPGLMAEYYNNNTLTGNPVLRRVEANVDNNWSTGSPAKDVINNDNFSAKYTGYFIAPVAGTYYFGGVNDDYLKIMVNNQLVYDNGYCPGAVCYGNALTLAAGQTVPFVASYGEATGPAYARIFVKGAVAEQIVKQDWLQTMPIATNQYSGLRGSYYYDDGTHDPTKLTNKFMTRQDPMVNFVWGSGAAVPNGPVDNYYVSWDGFFTAPVAGNYKFGVRADDGSRITINGQLRLDRWNTLGEAYDATGITLAAGQTVPIKVEYYEVGGGATMQLLMKAPNTSPDGGVVDPQYLSPGNKGLPVGWNLSADASGSLAYERLEVRQNGDLILYDGDGSTALFKYTNGGYTPPVDTQAVLIKNTDNSYSLTDASGRVYIFNVDGTLRTTSSPVDDRNPAALQYEYQAQNGMPRLRRIVDSVDTSRFGTIYYAGDTECSTVPTGFDATPPNMICAFTTSDGKTTQLLYKAGQLARILGAGNMAQDMAYDTNNMLVSTRDMVTNDAIMAGTRANDSSLLVEISYDAIGRIVALKGVAPQAGAARSRHTIEYLPSESRRHIDGMPEPAGYLQRIVYDSMLRTTKSCDNLGLCADSVWAANKDLLLSSTDSLGLMSTTIYDTNDQPTDSYGPAPASWFGADRRPLAANLAQVPRTQTNYDEGIVGPAVALYNAKNFNIGGTNTAVLFGAPKLHQTGIDTAMPSSMYKSWGSVPPVAVAADMNGWGLSATGKLKVPTTATYNFQIWHDDGIKLWIDDKLVANDWSNGAYRATNASIALTDGQSYRYRLDYYDIDKANSALDVYLAPSTVAISSAYRDWGDKLKPNYNLVTSSVNYDSQLGNTTNSIAYQDAALGTIASSTLDPAGQNLKATSTYEANGTGYLRQLSKTLPGGNTTTYQYYGATEKADNPCTSEVEAISQAGFVKNKTEPDPDGSGPASPRVSTTLYNSAGKTVASRLNNDPWTCTSHDDRGRVVEVKVPTIAGRAGRTITTNYNVDNNPLKVRSVDSITGTSEAMSDMLGRSVWSKDINGNEVSVTYDNLGRIDKKVSIVGTETTTYDNYGRITGYLLNGTIQATMTYDAFGRVSTIDYPQVKDPTTGQTMKLKTITYDQLGRAIGKTTQLASGADYTEASSVSPSGVVYGSNQTLGTQSLAANYTFDTVGRLTKALVGTTTYEYGYNAPALTCNSRVGNNPNAPKNSNRTSQITKGLGVNTQPRYHCYDNADRLIFSTDSQIGKPTYDDHGNTKSLAGGGTPIKFEYDALDYNTSITQGANRVEYKKTASGTVLQKTELLNGGVQKIYKYLAGGRVLQSCNPAQPTVCQTLDTYINLPGGVTLTLSPAAVDATKKSVYSIKNMHGDTALTVNANGAASSALFAYDPFGQTQGTGPANATDASMGWAASPTRKSEQLFSISIIQMGARVYLPSQGRFLQVDPVEGGTPNAYAYMPDPINFSDYNGMWGWSTFGRIAAAVVAVVAVVAIVAVMIIAAPVIGIIAAAVAVVALGVTAGAAGYYAATGRADKGMALSAVAGGLGGWLLGGAVMVASAVAGFVAVGPGLAAVAPKAADTVGRVQERAGGGVYQFEQSNGSTYTGMTSRIPSTRLAEHVSSGKLSPGGLVRITNMPGASRLELRVAEQIRINSLGGVDSAGVGNKINSIAEKYWDDLGIGRF